MLHTLQCSETVHGRCACRQHKARRQQSGASSQSGARTSSETRKSPSIVITGVNAFSIWMNATERKRYTALPNMRVIALKRPTGSIRVQKNRQLTGLSAATMFSTRQHSSAARPENAWPNPDRVMGYVNPARTATGEMLAQRTMKAWYEGLWSTPAV